MPNLLPSTEKKRVRREYKLRLATVWLFHLAVLGIIAGIAIFPSTVTLQQRLDQLTDKRDQFAKQEETVKAKELRGTLKRTDTRLAVLEPYDQHVPVYVLVEQLLTKAGDNVAINGIRYTRSMQTPKEEGSDTSTDSDTSSTSNAPDEPFEKVTMSVTGVAETRDSLISFKDTLRSLKHFDEVTLPVSNLAARADIKFTLQITSRF